MGVLPPTLVGEMRVGLVPSVAMAQMFMVPLRSLANAMDVLSGDQLGLRSEAVLFVSRVATPPVTGIL